MNKLHILLTLLLAIKSATYASTLHSTQNIRESNYIHVKYHENDTFKQNVNFNRSNVRTVVMDCKQFICNYKQYI